MTRMPCPNGSFVGFGPHALNTTSAASASPSAVDRARSTRGASQARTSATSARGSAPHETVDTFRTRRHHSSGRRPDYVVNAFTPVELLGPLNDVEERNAPRRLYVEGDVEL